MGLCHGKWAWQSRISLPSFSPCRFCCLLFTVSATDAGDRVSSMLSCPLSLLFRLAQLLRHSHCATPYSRSEKDSHGRGFSGLWQLFSRLFLSVQLFSSRG